MLQITIATRPSARFGKRFCAHTLHMLLLLAALTLSGCSVTGLYPVDATQTIVISESGQVQVQYEGRFNDSYPQIMAFAQLADQIRSDETGHPHAVLPSHDEFTQELLDGIRRERGLDGSWIVKITSDAGGGYLYNFRLAPNRQQIARVDEQILPEYVLFFSQPRISGDRNNIIEHSNHVLWELLYHPHDKKALELDAIHDGVDEAIYSKASALFLRTIEQVRSQVRGRLIVKSAAPLNRHNAADVQRLPDGMHQYTWHIAGQEAIEPDWQVILNTSP